MLRSPSSPHLGVRTVSTGRLSRLLGCLGISWDAFDDSRDFLLNFIWEIRKVSNFKLCCPLPCGFCFPFVAFGFSRFSLKDSKAFVFEGCSDAEQIRASERDSNFSQICCLRYFPNLFEVVWSCFWFAANFVLENYPFLWSFLWEGFSCFDPFDLKKMPWALWQGFVPLGVAQATRAIRHLRLQPLEWSDTRLFDLQTVS